MWKVVPRHLPCWGHQGNGFHLPHHSEVWQHLALPTVLHGKGMHKIVVGLHAETALLCEVSEDNFFISFEIIPNNICICLNTTLKCWKFIYEPLKLDWWNHLWLWTWSVSITSTALVYFNERFKYLQECIYFLFDLKQVDFQLKTEGAVLLPVNYSPVRIQIFSFNGTS